MSIYTIVMATLNKVTGNCETQVSEADELVMSDGRKAEPKDIPTLVRMQVEGNPSCKSMSVLQGNQVVGSYKR
jgi:hypothetical protein